MSPMKAALAMAAMSLPVAYAPCAEADAGYGRQGMSFQFQARVPLVCWVRLSESAGVADEDGMINLGLAREFCNAPRGYRVIMQHAENLEGAAFIRGGVRIPLSASGETVLSDTNMPNLESATALLDLGDHPERFNALAFRIEAKW